MAEFEYTEIGDQCCANCRHSYKLKKWDYSHGGCEHTEMEGFVCMAFADEGIAIWMVGNDKDIGTCEAWGAKES